MVTPSYLHQRFDEFWRGKDKVKLDGDYWQHIASVSFDYGLTEDRAVDGTAGWVWSETDADMLGATGGNVNDHGLTDITFGIRQRFIDEEDFNLWVLPSLGARIGGIIQGTYDKDCPFSPGDGASGAEISLLCGKTIVSGVGLWGDVGYRFREGHVPDDWFGSVGMFASWRFLSLTAAYRFTQGLSGEDIGDPGFTFPTVKEISQNVEASLGVTDPGGRHYQVFYAHTIDGRNTGKRDILGAAITLTF